MTVNIHIVHLFELKKNNNRFASANVVAFRLHRRRKFNFIAYLHTYALENFVEQFDVAFFSPVKMFV
jgi:hypothetical protein